MVVVKIDVGDRPIQESEGEASLAPPAGVTGASPEVPLLASGAAVEREAVYYGNLLPMTVIGPDY